MRLFAGWKVTEEEVYCPDFAEHGYKHGVPSWTTFEAA
jgi:hypothetical protein